MGRTNMTYEQKKKTRNGVRRMMFAMVAICLELCLLYLTFFRLQKYEHWINAAFVVISVVVCLAIYGGSKDTTMKMPWIMMILLVPVFGIFLYLLIGLSGSTQRMRIRFEKVDRDLLPILPDGKEALSALRSKDKGLANIARYLKSNASYPAYHNTDVIYYDDASKGLEAQKKELLQKDSFLWNIMPLKMPKAGRESRKSSRSGQRQAWMSGYFMMTWEA